MALHVRRHGRSGPPVVLVHGGPGAAGDLGDLGEVLGATCRVLEPFQRRCGSIPVTVAQHVADLAEAIKDQGTGERPVLVGHSFGAMLALAFAAEWPALVSGIALVGCGTFDGASRVRFKVELERRLRGGPAARLAAIDSGVSDPDERLRLKGEIIEAAYAFEARAAERPAVDIDARGNRETWADMLRLQDDGTYPAAFANIEAPVLMLHGSHDPHPGPSTRDVLAAHVAGLDYAEIPRCGHSPWREVHGRGAFLHHLLGFCMRVAGPVS